MATGGDIRQEPVQRNFTFPSEMQVHIEKVMAGEYAVPWDAGKPCLVLDIGANCGAFSVYAKLAWPLSEVDAFEPNPEMVKYLRQNIEGLPGITVHESAVGDLELDKLYLGKNNPGEGSQYNNGIEQSDETIDIEVTDPESLLSYDIVKLDCEGAESYVLARLDLTQTKFVMYEYHSEQDRRFCDEVMAANGFSLIHHRCTAVGYGVAKYQRFA